MCTASHSTSLPEGQQEQTSGERTQDNSELFTSVAISAQPLPALPAPLSRDLWREALGDLPKDVQQKLEIPDSDQKSLPEHIDELLEVTNKRQDECEKKFWRVRVGDHEIVLRDYAARIVSCLKTIGDIAIQFAPPQASIAWSAVKIVMQVRRVYHLFQRIHIKARVLMKIRCL